MAFLQHCSDNGVPDEHEIISMIDPPAIYYVRNPVASIFFIEDFDDQVARGIKPVSGASIVETVSEVQEVHLEGQEADEEYEVPVLKRLPIAHAVTLIRLAEAFHDLLHHQQNGKQKYHDQFYIPDNQTELVLLID